MRPVILDLYCKAGGMAMGYFQAGFDVVGIDIEPQPNYPFEFHQADALSINPKKVARNFDAVHASPPCQAYSITRYVTKIDDHPDLVPATRVLLERTGLPYIIENVPGAPLVDPIQVCGSYFGLSVRRHRIFEVNIWGIEGTPCNHRWQELYRPFRLSINAEKAERFYGFEVDMEDQWKPTGTIPVYGNGQLKESIERETELIKIAMGIHWMNKKELNQAIPPAYALHLGRQLLREIKE